MKSTAESPVKLPFKSDFTVKFECNSRYLRSFETKAATPKGPFRVRFPAGVPNKKEPFGSFLFGFRCGSRPAVRPTACGGTRSAATKYSRREYFISASPHTNAAANDPPVSAEAIAPSVMNASPMSSFCLYCI